LADDVDTAFDRCYQAHGEGGSSLAAWLGTGGGGAGQVAAVRAALAAGAALVRLLTLCGSTLDASVLRYQPCTTHTLLLLCLADFSSLFSCGWWCCSEEVVERAVSLARDLVVDNGLMPGMGAGKSRYAL
jgi:hypothetical protein